MTGQKPDAARLLSLLRAQWDMNFAAGTAGFFPNSPREFCLPVLCSWEQNPVTGEHTDMKGTLLTAFRALVFALSAFALLAISGIEVRSSVDVAVFVVGLAAFWILIEKIFIARKRQKNK